MLIPNGECNYLLSGKLPTVRQATYSQACTQPSHRHAPKRHRHAPKSLHRLAPNNRILSQVAFVYEKPEFLGKYEKLKRP